MTNAEVTALALSYRINSVVAYEARGNRIVFDILCDGNRCHRNSFLTIEEARYAHRALVSESAKTRKAGAKYLAARDTMIDELGY